MASPFFVTRSLVNESLCGFGGVLSIRFNTAFILSPAGLSMAKSAAIRISGPASYSLPTGMTREIGRIIVAWAYWEAYAQAMIWEIMGISAPMGRLAVRQPRLSERFELFRDIAALKKISMDEELLSSIISTADRLQSTRDIIAHGTWRKTLKNGWFVQKSRGNWEKKYKHIVSGKRSIISEAVPMSQEYMRSITAQIEDAISNTRTFRESLDPPPPP